VSRSQVGVYCRVSRDEQDPGLQVREVRTYVRRRGWKASEYVDHGWSGALDARPELDRLMRDVRRGLFSVVVVWKFDRFARSVRHLVLALDEFRALDVGFVSITEAIDTATPLGRAMFTIVGAIAEFERELIRERVRAGLARARAEGKRLGRPRRWTDEQAARVARLRRGGASWSTIARKLRVTAMTARRAFASLNSSPERDDIIRARRRRSSSAISADVGAALAELLELEGADGTA
jgi:DNA invertase Pin-like site-specific DNA recombinase